MKRVTRNSSTSNPRRIDFDATTTTAVGMTSPWKRRRGAAGVVPQGGVASFEVATTVTRTPEEVTDGCHAMHLVTPAKSPKHVIRHGRTTPKKARRRLNFDRSEAIEICDNVRLVYKLIRKVTGSVGGNGSFGAIYGELTIGSMQKMVNLMKEHTGLGPSSRFIDVGSGIGKPNLHVLQDPGVEFSYGIEMERSRWLLGLSSLNAVLKEAGRENSTLGYQAVFGHGNIKTAKTFDPFTHVYMFSIGFPPSLWDHLAKMFNASRAPYLICFHAPKTIVSKYGFNVTLITQTPTSMHGSSEGHSGYLYKRTTTGSEETLCVDIPIVCDEAFHHAYKLVKSGKEHICKAVLQQLDEELFGGMATRTKKVIHCVESDVNDEEKDSE